jgi:hypothetical protein
MPDPSHVVSIIEYPLARVLSRSRIGVTGEVFQK